MNSKSFSQVSKNIFLKQEKLEALILFRKNGSSYQELGALKKDGDAGEGFVKNKKTIKKSHSLKKERVIQKKEKKTEKQKNKKKLKNRVIFIFQRQG